MEVAIWLAVCKCVYTVFHIYMCTFTRCCSVGKQTFKRHPFISFWEQDTVIEFSTVISKIMNNVVSEVTSCVRWWTKGKVCAKSSAKSVKSPLSVVLGQVYWQHIPASLANASLAWEASAQRSEWYNIETGKLWGGSFATNPKRTVADFDTTSSIHHPWQTMHKRP